MELFSKVLTMPRLEQLNIDIVTNENVTNISSDKVYCKNQAFDADTVVIAVGHRGHGSGVSRNRRLRHPTQIA
jgi:NADH dehydrogenase FAD-containing subunit